jgi:hypothetical protein
VSCCTLTALLMHADCHGACRALSCSMLLAGPRTCVHGGHQHSQRRAPNAGVKHSDLRLPAHAGSSSSSSSRDLPGASPPFVTLGIPCTHMLLTHCECRADPYLSCARCVSSWFAVMQRPRWPPCSALRGSGSTASTGACEMLPRSRYAGCGVHNRLKRLPSTSEVFALSQEIKASA